MTLPQPNPKEQAAHMDAARGRAIAAWESLGSTRLGKAGYLCVLGYLSAGPATTIDVARAFGIGRQCARELIQRMGELGMAHTAGTVRTGRAGPAMPLWVAGRGRIDRLGMPSRERFPELMQLAQILAALEQPMRAKDLARETGSGEQMVRDLLGVGRSLRLMHIVAWDVPSNPQGGGQPVACWVLGQGRDAPRPKPMGGLMAKRRWSAANAARRQMLQMLHAVAGSAADARESEAA